tara:strand:- start:45 stop:320 length:276 start_codon:yes stop_codon:yes gene_type:complete
VVATLAKARKVAKNRVAAPSRSETSLSKWTKQDWGYAGKKGKSVYLPKEKRERLKSTEKGRRKLARASAVKRAATRAGRQYSRHGLAKGTS